ncbi:cytochrome c family protein [bacterium]|nr:cytochrome c family protein [bacterium]
MRKATIILVAIALCIGVSAAGETTAVGNVPKVLVLGSLSKVYEPVRFNHPEHVSAAGGCADCHHQHGTVQVDACAECHPIDPSVFKKNLNVGKLKACGECHPASERPGSIARRGLKDAYHQACFKCHKSDVGSGVKNLAGCTEMCHVLKAPEKRDGKK